MNKEQMVSIIIPTFNTQDYLCYAIESCIHQSYQNVEIIVVDDGSSDDTRIILGKYIESKQIRYFYQEKKGVSSARNLGLDLAEGGYIQFLDADDMIEPDKIKKQVHSLQNKPSVLGVYCRWSRFMGSNIHEQEMHKGVLHRGKIRKQLLKGNIMPIHACIIRRTAERFDEALSGGEDWDFWFRAFGENGKIESIDEVLCCVRIHENNSSHDTELMKRNDVLVIDKMLIATRHNRLHAGRCEFEKSKRVFGRSKIEAIRYLMRAFYHNPATLLMFISFLMKRIAR